MEVECLENDLFIYLLVYLAMSINKCLAIAVGLHPFYLGPQLDVIQVLNITATSYNCSIVGLGSVHVSLAEMVMIL